MAAVNQQRGTVLQVLNDVARRMGYAPFASVSADRTSLTWVGYLNDALAEVGDYGDWPQLYEEVSVSASPGQGIVEVNASAPLRRIAEVHHGSARSPLTEIDLAQWRLLSRSSALGTPRQFALVDTSGLNQRLRVVPTPSTAAASGRYNVGCYAMPRTYGSADGAAQLPFSRPLCVNLLYVRTLQDEEGGGVTKRVEAQYAIGRKMLGDEHNRNNAAAGEGAVVLRAPRLW